ncbi:MAG: phosphonoacetaldehyde hydrolase [Planctomycetota bacterium]
MKIKAVILDWAGTTVDYGSRAPSLAFRQVFELEGVAITDAEARLPMGMSKRDHIAAITALPRVANAWKELFGREAAKEDIDRMYRRFAPIQKELLARHSDVIPGVVEVIRECRQRGLKIGSTTGYSRELMAVVAPLAAAQGYSPDVIVCSDDVLEGRPSPHMNIRAAELLGVEPISDILVIDDTEIGCQAGKNSGCLTVGVAKTGNMLGKSLEEIAAEDPREIELALVDIEKPMRAAGANYVIRSVADLPDLIREIEGDG